jgi:hypothetical protein
VKILGMLTALGIAITILMIGAGATQQQNAHAVNVDQSRIAMCTNHGAIVAVIQAKLGLSSNDEIANKAGNYTVTCILHPEQRTVNTLP